MKISQSLIKEVQKPDHCPKQIYYSFVEGKDLIEPSDAMLMGRYFETGLLGACRGGEVQEATYSQINLKPNKSANKPAKVEFLKSRGHDVEGLTVSELDEKLRFEPAEYINGEKHKPYQDCDELIGWAKEVLSLVGLDIEKGDSQKDIETELLSAAIDHRNINIDGDGLANYDIKWTATKEDDRWNGWGDPESMTDTHIQAVHYTLASYEETGKWMPFYFLVFGKDYWVKIIRYKITQEAINIHKKRISDTSATIREYAEKDYKGNGSFNKCQQCPFKDICPDKALKPEIETITI